ncbi:MAG: DUF1549 and DUF1553 domain-containing protein [Acidobacteriota bacterium]|nr:DUF1549 and DUF1553 domain-containing protein [Acidobacteriota bacterium]
MKAILVLVAGSLLLPAAAIPVAPLGTYKPMERKFWAFQARKDVTAPVLSDAADKRWVKTPIDAFILDNLKKSGLQPAPQAGRLTLIRRITYDLHGVPPTPEEVDAFVKDKSPNAWAKVVDRLLASPRYGEQWGRHWLDVVRFAESDGYEYDTHRPDAYRYRDYVVRSFNTDKPYDEFVKEQLAGDEMDPANEEYLIASGFNRMGPLRKNVGNQKVAGSRNEVLVEMTNIVGAAYLGVTVGCARCHDHKFDPFRQSDYYRMMGYFAQTQPHDLIQASKDEQEAWKTKAAPVQKQIADLQTKMQKAPESEKNGIAMQLDDLEDKLPAPLPSVYTVSDDQKNATPIEVLFHGDYLQPTAKVGARPLGILLPEGVPEKAVDLPKPRLELASWVADPSNPLTARVMVNRVWEYHFGRGIVSTPNDFGRMGGRPSNPELLDYLANQYVANGWHMKPLHRMILLSSAYRQASESPLEKIALEKDPENALVWKFARRRLEAEEIRDSMLAISGRLNPKSGGPSVMVPIDQDLVKMLKRPQYWVTTRDKSEYDRRSLYMIYKRNLQLPFMGVFDAPDSLLSCPRREQATHAPQALEMMNGATSNSLAEKFAERLKNEAKSNAARVDRAWRLAVGRPPTPKEKSLALQFVSADPGDPAVLKELALDIFNLNAFLYVN